MPMLANPATVNFQNMEITARAAREVGGFTPNELELNHCHGLTPSVVAAIARSSTIETLTINNSDLTDEGLNLLWPPTQVVILACPRIGENGFREIKNAQSLTYLTLEGANITDRVIARLVEAPTIAELELYDVQITEGSAPLLAQMPSLTSVYITYNEVNARVAKKLKRLKPRIEVVFVGAPGTVPNPQPAPVEEANSGAPGPPP
jgi:hypothetical protein